MKTRRREQVLWWIENEPLSDYLDWPPARYEKGKLDAAGLAGALEAWKTAIARHPYDSQVAFQAAKWVKPCDEGAYREFFQASLEAQPDYAPAIAARAAQTHPAPAGGVRRALRQAPRTAT